MVLADYANFEIDEDANGNPILRDSDSGVEVTFTEDVEISDAVAIAGALTADSANISNLLEAGSVDVSDNLEAGSVEVLGALTTESADVADNLEAESVDVLGALTTESADVADNLEAGSATIDGVPYTEKADLTGSDGVLVSEQVPDLAITQTFVVEDETERLALDVEEGDVAIQEDNETTYIFTGGDPSDDDNWSVIQFDVLGAIDGSAITPASVDTDSVANSDYNETVETLSGSGTLTVDLEAANLVRVEATGDVTIEFSNVTSSPPGNSVTIYLEDDDDTGPHTVTWPASVVWDGGDAIGEIPESSNVEASLLTDDGGTEWRGGISGEDFA